MSEKTTNENLIHFPLLIARAKKAGVDFGKGNPYNRLRYYTKIGLLPHAKRKSYLGGDPAGVYPESVLETLVDIDRKLKEGKSVQAILREQDTTADSGSNSHLSPVQHLPSNTPTLTYMPVLTARPEKPSIAADKMLDIEAASSVDQVSQEALPDQIDEQGVQTSFLPLLGFSAVFNQLYQNRSLIPSFAILLFLLIPTILLGYQQFFAQKEVAHLPSLTSLNSLLARNEAGSVLAASPGYINLNAETDINSLVHIKEGAAFPSGQYEGVLKADTLTADRSYLLPDADGTLCVTSGNCAGAGGGVTITSTSTGIGEGESGASVGGTAGQLAKFTGTQSIGNSIISDDGSLVTVAGSLTTSGDISGVNLSASGTLSVGSLASATTNFLCQNASVLSSCSVLPGGLTADSVLTDGSVLFADGGLVSQDNSHFFWDPNGVTGLTITDSPVNFVATSGNLSISLDGTLPTPGSSDTSNVLCQNTTNNLLSTCGTNAGIDSPFVHLAPKDSGGNAFPDINTTNLDSIYIKKTSVTGHLIRLCTGDTVAVCGDDTVDSNWAEKFSVGYDGNVSIGSSLTSGTVLNIGTALRAGVGNDPTTVLPITLVAPLTGANFDLSTGVIADNISVTGIDISLPTFSINDDPTTPVYYTGLDIHGSPGGVLTAENGSFTTFNGVTVTTPDLLSNNTALTGGALVANAINIATGDAPDGTILNGINVGNTAGASTNKTGINIGTGWDNGVLINDLSTNTGINILADSLSTGTGLNISTSSTGLSGISSGRLLSLDQSATYAPGSTTTATLFTVNRNLGASNGALQIIQQDQVAGVPEVNVKCTSPNDPATGSPPPNCSLRSVGGATGTGTISSSGVTVTGSGTSFLTQLQPGYAISAGSQLRIVNTITDNTHLTTTVAFSPVLAGGTAFGFRDPPSISWNHTVDPAGGNSGRLLLVGVSIFYTMSSNNAGNPALNGGSVSGTWCATGCGSPTSLSLNTFSSHIFQSGSNYFYEATYAFYLFNPTSGAGTVSFTATAAAQQIVAGSTSFYNVASGSGGEPNTFQTSKTSFGTGNPSVNVYPPATNSSQKVVDFVTSGFVQSSLSGPTSGQLKQWNQKVTSLVLPPNFSPYVFSGSSVATQALDQNKPAMSWTVSPNNTPNSLWTNVAVVLNSANSGTTGTVVVDSTGPLAKFEATCQVGTCLDQANILQLNQTASGATAPVLSISNGGSGAAILLPTKLDISGGISFGDTFLYRSGAGVLKTDGSFAITNTSNPSGVATLSTVATATRAISFPDAAGTVCLTSTCLANGSSLFTLSDGIGGTSTIVPGDTLSTLAGNGITTAVASDSSTISLGPLTANWDQTGTGDIVLNNANSNLQILENGAGPSDFGIIDVAAITGNQTYTFSGVGGTVWTSGNDGSGSGLDADTLDSLNSLQFLRVDTSDSFDSGTLTIADGTTLTVNSSTINLGNAAADLINFNGSVNTSLTFEKGTNDLTLSVTAPTGNSWTATIPSLDGNDEFCFVNEGNCAGSGSGVTTAGGTTNYVPKFTGAQSIGNSQIFDNGTSVGINTAGPDRRLDVLDASNPQLRLTQTDATNYTDFQVDSSGNLTINASGTSTTISDDLAVNGDDLTTSQASFNLLNTTATTINLGGAATSLSLGIAGASGSVDISGGSGSTGCTVNGTTGDLSCTGNIGGSGSGSVGYWSRTSTTLSPSTSNDIVSIASSTGVPLSLTNTSSSNSLLVEDTSSDTTPFVIDASGNVGVGTTTPNQLIHLSSSSNTSEQITSTATTNQVSHDGTTVDMTIVNDSGTGSVDWTYPWVFRAAINDGFYATIDLTAGQTSHYMKATGFGFSIPESATILGVVVEVDKNKTGAGTVADSGSTKLAIAGEEAGSAVACSSNCTWTGSDTYSLYGTSSELWGNALTPAIVNASGFGVALAVTASGGSATANVDHIRITVYYSTASWTGGVDSTTSTYKLSDNSSIGTSDQFTIDSNGNAVISGSLDFSRYKKRIAVFEGDSVSDTNFYSYAGYGANWVEQLTTTSSSYFGNASVYNYSMGGDTAAAMVSEYASEGATKAPSNNGDEAWYFVWGGSNDIYTGATDMDDVYDDLKTLWAAARADGFRVVAFTILPEGLFSPTQEGYRVELNELILSDPSLYDFVVQADTVIPDTGSGDYADTIHPSADGSQKIADLANTVITYQPWLLLPTTTATTPTDMSLILNPTGGNVGIGTTAPDNLLHLSSSGNTLEEFSTTATTNQVGHTGYSVTDCTDAPSGCSGVGTLAWTNPSRAQTQDDSPATATTTGATTHYLKAVGFGFSIPTGATIEGIKVEMDKYITGPCLCQESSLKVVKAGAVTGTAKSASFWTQTSDTDTYDSFGGSTDTWGTTWTAAEINSSGFGIAESVTIGCFGGCGAPVTASIDHIKITVYYTDSNWVAGVNSTTGSFQISNYSDLGTSDHFKLFADGSLAISGNLSLGVGNNISHYAGGIINAQGNVSPITTALDTTAGVTPYTACGFFCTGLVVIPNLVNTDATNLDVIFARGDVSSGITATNVYGLYAADPTGAGSITNNYGVYVADQTKGGTLNYGVYIAGGNTAALYTASDPVTHVFGASDELTIDSAVTDRTQGTSGALDLQVDAGNPSSGNVVGLNLDFEQTGADAAEDAFAMYLNLTQSDADGDLFGIYVNHAANSTTLSGTNYVDCMICLENDENTAAAVANAIWISSSGATSGAITTAINIADDDVTTDLSLQNGETIDNNTDGTISFSGSLYIPTATNRMALGTAINNQIGIYSASNFDSNSNCVIGCGAVFGTATLTNPTSPTLGIGLAGSVTTSNDSFVLATAAAFYANPATKGAASTITNAIGLYIVPQTVGSNGYGICFDCDGTFGTTTVASGIQWGTDANGVNLYRSGSDTLTTDDNIDANGTGTHDFEGAVQIDMAGTATANGVCHSGADSDTTAADRNLVVCTDGPGDIAEWYETKGEAAAGEIVSVSNESFTYESTQLDPFTGETRPEKTLLTISKLEKTTTPYQENIVGIVSTSPVRTYGADIKDQGSNPQPIALVGRVPVKVSSENGPINTGDPLTSSSIPGVAMKATQSGPIIGKALASYNEADPTAVGKVVVFVHTGWYVAPLENGNVGAQQGSDLALQTLSANTINTEILFVGDKKISVTEAGEVSIDGSVLVANNLLVKGNIEVEELTVGKLNLKTGQIDIATNKSKDSTGTSTLPNGQTQLTIETTAVTDKSRVLITPTGTTAGAILYVGEKQAGNGFTVKIDSPVTSDIQFDWLVVN